MENAVKENLEVMFMESVCDLEDLILNNIRDVKLSSPDYVGQDPEAVNNPPKNLAHIYIKVIDANNKKAALDFMNRIKAYEKSYEPISEDDLTYVKIINVGAQVIINRIRNFMQTRIVYFLMNLHIKPRSVWLSRVRIFIYLKKRIQNKLQSF